MYVPENDYRRRPAAVHWSACRAGCQQEPEDKLENAQESMSDAVDNVGDAVEETGEAIEQKAEEAQ
ncbi:hypothetical protein UMZ34_22795 [Halopseudomonas pachastrellae]|nr:hypothetical protein UMZ34_22795 [Halopseudomonas pachastrellae]